MISPFEIDFFFMDILIVFKSEAKQSHLWISFFAKYTLLKTEHLISKEKRDQPSSLAFSSKTGCSWVESDGLHNPGSKL